MSVNQDLLWVQIYMSDFICSWHTSHGLRGWWPVLKCDINIVHYSDLGKSMWWSSATSSSSVIPTDDDNTSGCVNILLYCIQQWQCCQGFWSGKISHYRPSHPDFTFWSQRIGVQLPPAEQRRFYWEIQRARPQINLQFIKEHSSINTSSECSIINSNIWQDNPSSLFYVSVSIISDGPNYKKTSLNLFNLTKWLCCKYIC